MTKVRNLSSINIATAIPAGAQLCEILDDDGSTCHGYELRGALTVLAVVARSPAAQAPYDTANAAIAADATKRAASLTILRNQVARVRVIPIGSRTDQDKWLLALSFLLLSEE